MAYFPHFHPVEALSSVILSCEMLVGAKKSPYLCSPIMS